MGWLCNLVVYCFFFFGRMLSLSEPIFFTLDHSSVSFSSRVSMHFPYCSCSDSGLLERVIYVWMKHFVLVTSQCSIYVDCDVSYSRSTSLFLRGWVCCDATCALWEPLPYGGIWACNHMGLLNSTGRCCQTLYQEWKNCPNVSLSSFCNSAFRETWCYWDVTVLSNVVTLLCFKQDIFSHISCNCLWYTSPALWSSDSIICYL